MKKQTGETTDRKNNRQTRLSQTILKTDMTKDRQDESQTSQKIDKTKDRQDKRQTRQKTANRKADKTKDRRDK